MTKHSGELCIFVTLMLILLLASLCHGMPGRRLIYKLGQPLPSISWKAGNFLDDKCEVSHTPPEFRFISMKDFDTFGSHVEIRTVGHLQMVNSTNPNETYYLPLELQMARYTAPELTTNNISRVQMTAQCANTTLLVTSGNLTELVHPRLLVQFNKFPDDLQPVASSCLVDDLNLSLKEATASRDECQGLRTYNCYAVETQKDKQQVSNKTTTSDDSTLASSVNEKKEKKRGALVATLRYNELSFTWGPLAAEYPIKSYAVPSGKIC